MFQADTITINVRAELSYENYDDHGFAGLEILAWGYEKDVEKRWNAMQFEDGKSRMISVDLAITPLRRDDKKDPTSHQIVYSDAESIAHTKPIVTDSATSGTVFLFSNSGSSEVLAHELGHLMGLDDEYTYRAASDQFPNSINRNSKELVIEEKTQIGSPDDETRRWVARYKRRGDENFGIMALTSTGEPKDYYFDHIIELRDKEDQFESGSVRKSK